MPEDTLDYQQQWVSIHLVNQIFLICQMLMCTLGKQHDIFSHALHEDLATTSISHLFTHSQDSVNCPLCVAPVL